jgi:hypothetical protein
LQNDQQYLQEKPYQIISGLYPSGWQTNCRFSEVNGITIRDCRLHPENYSLETSGFEFQNWPCPSSIGLDNLRQESLVDKTQTIEPYLLDTIRRMKERLNAVDIICFDWRVRSQLGLPTR